MTPLPESTRDMLQVVYARVAEEDLDGAIDVLLSHVDDLLSDGRFEVCDQMLSVTDVDQLDTYLIVGFLSTTRRAAGHLPERRHFVDRCRMRLAVLAPDRIDRLLSGLD